MAVRAVGLDIGTSGVRAAQLSVGKGTPRLERFGQVALPPGAVREGEVIDVPSVARAIKELWSSAKLSTKRVVVGVANQRVIVRQADLPWMPTTEMRSSLPMMVQDLLPMPVAQAILDFHPVEEFVTEEGVRTLRVLLVAAARTMVLSSLEAVRQAGLTATQVDLTPFAVLRSLASIDHLGTDPAAHGSAEALVDIGAKVTNIVVHQNGTPRFVRILLMGGDDVTEAVAERMGVPFEEADAMKQELGLGPAPGFPADGGPAAQVIESVGAMLTDEIRGSLDYYLAQAASSPLRQVKVSGGGARLGGLLQRLAHVTRVPVVEGTALSGLDVGKSRLSPDQLGAIEPVVTVPVGLAMGAAS